MGEPRAVNRRVEQVRSARMVICRVLMLDGTYYETQIDKRAVGLTLFDTVCDSVDLLEKDYFGLSYTDPSLPTVKLWLNHEKKISKQMKGLPWEFAFEVKFYPGDPQQLHEDLTRYQLCLQLRNDIVCGKLPCSVVTYTLLGSYTVQSELGDFDVEEYGPGIEYLKDMQFAPNQDRELLQKIAELHKTHRGQTPEEAELHFLENAKKLALYGVQLQDAKDAFGVDIQIGVCASGIIIFQDKLQINKFVWPKVIKMSYRRNKFYVKLRAGEFEDFQSQIGFRLLNVKLAKILWKICVEHHSFFRFRESEAPKKRGLFPRFGSTFRYSGRTMFQTRTAMQFSDRPSPYFDRVHSKRATYHGKTTNRSLDDEMYKRRPPRETEPPPPPRPQYIDDNHYPEKRHPVDEQEYSDREREGYGSEDDSPIDRKSRLEKIHAVPTPLSMVLNREKREHHENNVDEPPRYNHRYDDEDSLPEKRHHEDDEDVMVRKYNSYTDNFIHQTNSGKRVLHDIDITAINPVKKLNVSLVDKSCVKNDSSKIIGRKKMAKKVALSNVSAIQSCPLSSAESNKKQSRYVKKNKKTSPTISESRSSSEALYKQTLQTNTYTSTRKDDKESYRESHLKSSKLDYNENQWNSSKKYLKDTYTVKKGLRSDSLSQDEESPLVSSIEQPQTRENPQINHRENPQIKQDCREVDLLPQNSKQLNKSNSKHDTSDNKDSNLYKYNSLSNVNGSKSDKVTNLYVPKKRLYTSMQDFCETSSFTDRNRLEIGSASAGSSLDSLQGHSSNRIYTYSSDDSSDIGGSSLVVGEKYICDSSFQASTCSVLSEQRDYTKSPLSECDRAVITSDLSFEVDGTSSEQEHFKVPKTSSLHPDSKSPEQVHIKSNKTNVPSDIENVTSDNKTMYVSALGVVVDKITPAFSDCDTSENTGRKKMLDRELLIDSSPNCYITRKESQSGDKGRDTGISHDKSNNVQIQNSFVLSKPGGYTTPKSKRVTFADIENYSEDHFDDSDLLEYNDNLSEYNNGNENKTIPKIEPIKSLLDSRRPLQMASTKVERSILKPNVKSINNDIAVSHERHHRSNDVDDDDNEISINDNQSSNKTLSKSFYTDFDLKDVPEISIRNLDSVSYKQSGSFTPTTDNVYNNKSSLTEIDKPKTDNHYRDFDLIGYSSEPKRRDVRSNCHSNQERFDYPVKESSYNIKFNITEDIPTDSMTEDIPTDSMTEDIPTDSMTEDIPTDPMTEDIPVEVKSASDSIKVMLEKFKSSITESEISDVASSKGLGFSDGKQNVTDFVDDEMNVINDSKISRDTDEEIPDVTKIADVSNVDNDGSISKEVLSNVEAFVSDIPMSAYLDHEGIHNRGGSVIETDTVYQNTDSFSKIPLSDMKSSSLTPEHHFNHHSNKFTAFQKSDEYQFSNISSTFLEPRHQKSNKKYSAPETGPHQSSIISPTALEPKHHKSSHIASAPEPDPQQSSNVSSTSLEPRHQKSNNKYSAPEPGLHQSSIISISALEPQHYQSSHIASAPEPDFQQSSNISSTSLEPRHQQPSHISFGPGESLSVKMLQTSKVSIEHGSKVSIQHDEKTYYDNTADHMPITYNKTVTKLPVYKTVKKGSDSQTKSQQKYSLDRPDPTHTSEFNEDIFLESSQHLTTFQKDEDSRIDCSSFHTPKTNSKQEEVAKCPSIDNMYLKISDTQSSLKKDKKSSPSCQFESKKMEGSLSTSSISKANAMTVECLVTTPIVPKQSPLPVQKSVNSLPEDNSLSLESQVNVKGSGMFSSVGKFTKSAVEKPFRTSSVTSSMTSSFSASQPSLSLFKKMDHKNSNSSSSITDALETKVDRDIETNLLEHPQKTTSSLSSPFSLSQPPLSLLRSNPDVGVSSESLNDFSNDKPGNIHLASRFGSTPVISFSEAKNKKPFLSKAWQTGPSHRTFPKPLTFNPNMRHSSGSCSSLRDKAIPEESPLDKLRSSHFKIQQKTLSSQGNSPTHTESLSSFTADPVLSITPSLTKKRSTKTSLVNTTSSTSAITNYTSAPNVQSISTANSQCSYPTNVICSTSNNESTVYRDMHAKHDTIPVVVNDTFMQKMSHDNTSSTNSLVSPLCSTGVPNQSLSCTVPDNTSFKKLSQTNTEAENKSVQAGKTSPVATVSHHAPSSASNLFSVTHEVLSTSSEPSVYSMPSTSDYVNMKPVTLPGLHSSSSPPTPSDPSTLTNTTNSCVYPLSSSSSASSSSSLLLSSPSLTCRVPVSSSSIQQLCQTQKAVSKSVRIKTPETVCSTTPVSVLETQPSSMLHNKSSTFIPAYFPKPYNTYLPKDHKIPSSSAFCTTVTSLTDPSSAVQSSVSTMPFHTATSTYSTCNTSFSTATMVTTTPPSVPSLPQPTPRISVTQSSISTTQSHTVTLSYSTSSYSTYNTSFSRSTITSTTLPRVSSVQHATPSVSVTQSSKSAMSSYTVTSSYSTYNTSFSRSTITSTTPPSVPSVHQTSVSTNLPSLHEAATNSSGEKDKKNIDNKKQSNRTHVMYYDNSFDKTTWTSHRISRTKLSHSEGQEIHRDIQIPIIKITDMQIPNIKITPSDDDDTPVQYFSMTQPHQQNDLPQNSCVRQHEKNIGGAGHDYKMEETHDTVDQPSEISTDDKNGDKIDTKESSFNRLDVNTGSKSHIWKRTKTKQKFIQAIWAKVNSERIDSDMEESDNETQKTNITSVDVESKSVLSNNSSKLSMSTSSLSGSEEQHATNSDIVNTNKHFSAADSDGCCGLRLDDDQKTNNDNLVTLGDEEHISDTKSQQEFNVIEPKTELIKRSNIDRRTRTTIEGSQADEQFGNLCNHGNKDNKNDKCSAPTLKKDENGNTIKHKDSSTSYGGKTQKIMLKIKSSFGLSEDAGDGSHVCCPDDLHFLSELVLAVIIMGISILFLFFDVV